MPSRERTAICLPFLQIGLRLVLDQNSNSGYGGIYLKTTLQTCAVKVKEQPFGLLTSYHNEVSKILPSENQAVKLSSYKISKIVAYLSCFAGRMHFARTKILCGWQNAVLQLLTVRR